MKKVKKKPEPKKHRSSGSRPGQAHWLAVLLVLAVCSVLFGALASHNSFLYVFNDAEETNMLFTVGKSIFSGWVPYADIFDRQGFGLYLIYGLASLISSTSSLGVWVMECIALFLTGLFVWKTGRLFVSSLISLAFTVCSLALLSMSAGYADGGTASLFALPCVAAAFYLAIRMFQENLSGGVEILLIGLCGGICYFITPVYVGFWIALLLVQILRQAFKKEWLSALLNLVWFVMGAVIPVLLVMIYFIANNALANLIDVYFRLNWDSMASLTFIERIRFAFDQVADLLRGNLVLAVLLILSVCSAAYTRNVWSWLLIVLGFVFTAWTAYYPGYATDSLSLVLLLFALPGLLLPFWGLWLAAGKDEEKSVFTFLAFVLSLAGSGWFVYEGEDWLHVWNRQRTFAVQELSSLILESDDRTLLNYGMPDQGLYLAADILPATYYFQAQPLFEHSYVSEKNAQNTYIENAATEFVLTRSEKGFDSEEPEALLENYTAVQSEVQEKNGTTWEYTLWRRKTAE